MTESFLEQLQRLKSEALRDLKRVRNSDQLETWRIEYIGRKGSISHALRSIKDLADEERSVAGQAGNAVRQAVTEAFESSKDTFSPAGPVNGKSAAASDRHQTVSETNLGHLHPITIATRRARNIFAAMGFTIVEGPDVDEQKYNFDLLNIPPEHPARAATDTFYLKNLPDLVLRTHVSTLQNRGVLENHLTPPFKMMYYGPSFRSEKEDATHFSHFDQYEIMIVDEHINLAEFKGIIQTFYSLFFSSNFDIRFRPAYYPFVEPGFDVDLRDVVTGRGEWLEIAGGGMVHPNVLRNINVDPDKYQGVASGGGIDRLVMLKHGIPDGRALRDNDIRFLKQF